MTEPESGEKRRDVVGGQRGHKAAGRGLGSQYETGENRDPPKQVTKRAEKRSLNWKVTGSPQDPLSTASGTTQEILRIRRRMLGFQENV